MFTNHPSDRNKGTKREQKEIDETFYSVMHGKKPLDQILDELSTRFGRDREDIKRFLWRICRDASDYPDKRIFTLNPPKLKCKIARPLNDWGKEFVTEQIRREHSVPEICHKLQWHKAHVNAFIDKHRKIDPKWPGKVDVEEEGFGFCSEKNQKIHCPKEVRERISKINKHLEYTLKQLASQLSRTVSVVSEMADILKDFDELLDDEE